MSSELTIDQGIQTEDNQKQMDQDLQFSKFMIKDGNVYLVNQHLDLAIQVDIDNKEHMKKWGIDQVNVEMIKTQLNRNKEQGVIPKGYKDKYCVLFGGKVFHSFDTRKELEDFIKGPKNVGLSFAFYFPK